MASIRSASVGTLSSDSTSLINLIEEQYRVMKIYYHILANYPPRNYHCFVFYSLLHQLLCLCLRYPQTSPLVCLKFQCFPLINGRINHHLAYKQCHALHSLFSQQWIWQSQCKQRRYMSRNSLSQQCHLSVVCICYS